MRIQLTACRMELTPELRDRVERQIHFALSRFSRRIPSLSVRLEMEDRSGSSSSPDRCCTIQIGGGRSKDIVVRERHDDIHAAVALAVERVARSVERRLRLLDQSERSSSRSRPASARE